MAGDWRWRCPDRVGGSVHPHLVAQAVQSSSGAASALDPVLAKAFQWRSIGPARGGRSIAVSGVKGRPKEAYFGAVGGGLWKTVDGGENWTPVTDGQIRSSSVGAVAVSESSPDIVFIGMGEACIRGNIMAGDGVYKSTDAGKTWTHVGLADAHNISKIRIHPTNPNTVFVAAFGHHGAPNDERGVFKSADGGKTWKKVLFRNNKTGAVDLSIDPGNPNVIYAALWEAYRVEYQMSSGGPGSGLFKSTDGGETWTEITRNPGLPAGVDRPHRRIGVRCGPQARVRPRRARERRPLFVERCRRDLDAREFKPQHPSARVLLHACRGRSQERRHGLHAERERLQINGWRQDAHQRRPGHARRPSRPLDRSGQSSAPRDRQRRRRRGVDGRR